MTLANAPDRKVKTSPPPVVPGVVSLYLKLLNKNARAALAHSCTQLTCLSSIRRLDSHGEIT